MAADAVTTFALDGSAVLSFLFADSATFQGGAAVATTGPDNLALGPAAVVVRDRLAEGGGAIDKGWLAADRGPTSPLRGTVYLSWHANRPLPDHTVESFLWLASTRDVGKTWSDPVRVTEHFGGQIAVRADGTIDLVYSDRDGRVLLHDSSSDGGRTFAGPDTVAAAPTGEVIGLASLAITPTDSAVVCWAQGPETASPGYRVRCAVGGSTGWSVTDLDPAPDQSGAAGLPAVAANRHGIWVLSYRADSAMVSVRLHHSTDGGRSFAISQTLATRPFGLDRFCPAPSAPCRHTLAETGAYFAGDYVGISAAPNRIAVAYALPETDDPKARSTIFTTILRQ